MKAVYECVAVHDCPAGPHEIVLKSAGDEVRVSCPPHEFGRFVLGSFYEISVKEIPKPAKWGDFFLTF